MQEARDAGGTPAATQGAVMLASLMLSSLVTGAPVSPSTTTDPYRIFAQARRYWENQRYPAAVDYVIHVFAKMKRSDNQRHYNARWFAATNAVVVDGLSAEERAHPYHPGSGFVFGIPLFGAAADIGGKGTGTNGDLLGHPMLSPNYSFGIARYVPPQALTPAELVAEIRREFHDPNPAKVAALAKRESGLPTIATVYAVNRDYRVQLVGVEAYGGHRDYHLAIQPTHDPGRYRLRQLWINVQNFATDRLVSQGNFVDGPGPGVAWNVTFDNVGTSHYIVRETALAPMNAGPMRGTYIDFTVAFDDIRSGGIRPTITPADIGSGPTLTEPDH